MWRWLLVGYFVVRLFGLHVKQYTTKPGAYATPGCTLLLFDWAQVLRILFHFVHGLLGVPSLHVHQSFEAVDDVVLGVDDGVDQVAWDHDGSFVFEMWLLYG